VKSLFERFWRYLNSPVEDWWLMIITIGLCELILLGLVYWVGPLLPK
jgi:hypothetical protein